MYYATHGDSMVVKNVMQDFEQSGKVKLSADILSAIHEVIAATVSVSDTDIVQAMQLCYSQYNYVVCPHTATAVSYSFSVKHR